ncbi:MAG: membrane protein insertase YidC [Vicinamibacterales bacterium]
MERRVLLAISLSFLVLFLYQSLVPPPEQPPAPDGTPAAGAPAAAAGNGAVVDKATPPAEPTAAATEGVGALVAAAAEREFVIETNTVRATFTNRGARLKHWVLKRYLDRAGQAVDLVPADAGREPLPFSLAVDDERVTALLNESLFAVEMDPPPVINASASAAALTFVYESADGLAVQKRFTLQPSGYDVEFSSTVRRGSTALNPRILWGPGLGDEIAVTAGSGGFLRGNYVYPAAGFVHRDGSIKRYAGASASTAGPQQGSFRFAGVTDHYFVASVIEPDQPYQVEFAHVPIATAGGAGTVRQFVSFSLRFNEPPKALKFFVGPKQFDALSAISPEFTKVIDYGMFAVLAVPLRGALEWVHGYIGNYGWSIIALTILINLVMAPLRHKSVVSMRRMQEIQPQLKAIQDRYANLKITDPARGKMNEEVMALYREKGANPASGCLPMLLTLPVLFAFYSLLSQAIEIRGAGFVGWITDLSQRDPLYITPLLMGVTMFWQQRMQPGTGDPVQQKVMMFMPLMFTAMMIGAPSGLVIYWLVSQLWAIGQQYFTNWMIGPPKVVGVKR